MFECGTSASTAGGLKFLVEDQVLDSEVADQFSHSKAWAGR